jgi:hypothetical protein
MTNNKILKTKEITATNTESLERKVAKYIMKVRPNGGVNPLEFFECRAYLNKPIKRMRITHSV